MRKQLFRLAALGLLTFSFAVAEVREWTREADGKKITAEFAGMKDDATIQIKMANGQIFDVPLSSLSAADNDFVKSLKKPGDGEMKESPKETAKGGIPEGEVTITLSGVHMCCGDCEDAVLAIKEHDKVKVDPAVEVSVNRSDNTVTIKAPSGNAAQTALRAVTASGFYGISDHATLKIADLKEDDFTTGTMVVRDPHLCCRGCVKAFTKAVEDVDGVEEVDAKPGSTRVAIKGEAFKPYEVMKALREVGIGGTFQ
jgi:copper chaperone CopZ